MSYSLNEMIKNAPAQGLNLAKKVKSDVDEVGPRTALWNYYAALLTQTKVACDTYIEDPDADPALEEEAEPENPSLVGLAYHAAGRLQRNVQARIVAGAKPVVALTAERVSSIVHVDLIAYSEIVIEKQRNVTNGARETLATSLANLEAKVAAAKLAVHDAVNTTQERVQQFEVVQDVTKTLAPTVDRARTNLEDARKRAHQAKEQAKLRLHIAQASAQAITEITLKYARSATLTGLPGDALGMGKHYLQLGVALARSAQSAAQQLEGKEEEGKQQEKEQEQEQEEQQYAELDAKLASLAHALWDVVTFWKAPAAEEQPALEAADEKVDDEKEAEEVEQEDSSDETENDEVEA